MNIEKTSNLQSSIDNLQSLFRFSAKSGKILRGLRSKPVLTFTVKVDGLDSQSQNKIRAEMQKLGKVESVQINQKSRLVNVTFKIDHKISNSQVMQAVRKAGYTPKEIIKSPLELSQLEKMIPQKK